MRLLTKYVMDLFSLPNGNIACFEINSDFEYVLVDSDNIELVKQQYDRKLYKIFHNVVKSKNSIGVFAMHNGQIVGYGIAKAKDVKDTFYKIDNTNITYLSKFFVKKEYRGQAIYPSMISFLLKHKKSDKYYISTHYYNSASIAGLKKVGFRFCKKVSIYRMCGITLNKIKLNKV